MVWHDAHQRLTCAIQRRRDGLRPPAHSESDLAGRRPFRGSLCRLPAGVGTSGGPPGCPTADPPGAAVIEQILPPGVAAEEAFGDLPDVVLFPDEETVVANAVEKRRREFATARACARAALAKLGVPPVPIVPGHRGAPRWPQGVVGSCRLRSRPPDLHSAAAGERASRERFRAHRLRWPVAGQRRPHRHRDRHTAP
jgi:hypothetical protein